MIRAGTSASLLVSNIIGLMRLRLTTIAVFAVVFVLAPPVWAADAQWPAKLGTLTAKFGDIGTSNLVSKRDAPKASPLEVEAGFVGLSTQAYDNSGGGSSRMILYTYRDSSGAYQGYSFLRAQRTDSPDVARILVNGNRVLYISGWPGTSAQNQKSIEDWLQSISDGVASPPIATYLPEKNKEPLSERYALGPNAFRQVVKELGRDNLASLADVAGFNSGAEAMFAKYKSGNDEAALLLIEYPTPQLAELHLRHLQRALSADKKSGSSVERKGSLLSIVLGPTSAEYAEKLRGAINYETEVTWNEPSTTATDPPITSTLVKIIIATMVLMGMAFVLGIAFGGVRVITKRLFPGKVFDRPAQMEVLQLGLSGKPIDPRDMY
ncbi:MAG: DUF6599 family protein [Candidatus Acidiferrum sp.]